MRGIDLENASYQTEGLKMLEEYKPELFVYNSETEAKGIKQVSLSELQAQTNIATNESYVDLLK